MDINKCKYGRGLLDVFPYFQEKTSGSFEPGWPAWAQASLARLRICLAWLVLAWQSPAQLSLDSGSAGERPSNLMGARLRAPLAIVQVHPQTGPGQPANFVSSVLLGKSSSLSHFCCFCTSVLHEKKCANSAQPGPDQALAPRPTRLLAEALGLALAPARMNSGCPA